MDAKLIDFLCHALETEKAGIAVYKTALSCTRNQQLHEEWQQYLEETEDHVDQYFEFLDEAGVDPQKETPGRAFARTCANGLLELMAKATTSGDPEAAEIIAAECVLLAETKCHLNWELVGELAARKLTGGLQKTFQKAQAEVQEEEDVHLSQTKAWARELWTQRLGIPAVLPRPEEIGDMTTPPAADRQKNARNDRRGPDEPREKERGSEA